MCVAVCVSCVWLLTLLHCHAMALAWQLTVGFFTTIAALLTLVLLQPYRRPALHRLSLLVLWSTLLLLFTALLVKVRHTHNTHTRNTRTQSHTRKSALCEAKARTRA